MTHESTLTDAQEKRLAALRVIPRLDRTPDEQREYTSLIRAALGMHEEIVEEEAAKRGVTVPPKRKRGRPRKVKPDDPVTPEIPQSDAVRFVEGLPVDAIGLENPQSGKFEKAAKALKEHPGWWAVVSKSGTREYSTRLAQRIRSCKLRGFRELKPLGRFEAHPAPHHDIKDSFDVYARFIEEGK